MRDNRTSWNKGLHPSQWMSPTQYTLWRQKARNRRTGTNVKCSNCRKIIYRNKFWLDRHKRHFCSNNCRYIFTKGPNHHQWGGGRYLAPSIGYVMMYTGNGKRQREHILIVERGLGRQLPKGAVVHHINFNKTDNRKCNLLLCSKEYHTWLEKYMAEIYAKEHFGGD
jgi:endogenous inhibitor of DNA gyrase (YacG/DUF329 family)